MRDAGAGVKLRVNSLPAVIPGPLGAPVKRVNTGVEKEKKTRAFFSDRPLV